MASAETLNEHIIIDILEDLRKPPEGKIFETVATEKWSELGLDGEPNPTFLENILIEAVNRLYDTHSAEATNISRIQAKRHDISLLMFGLLDGYYHTKTVHGHKENVPLTERYNQYLSTDVFVKLDYPGQGSYAEIKQADKKAGRKQDRPLNNLTHIAGGCKREIATKLFELIQSGEYKKCPSSATIDEKTGQRTNLPKPHYTLESFLSTGAEGRNNFYPPLSRKIRQMVKKIVIFLIAVLTFIFMYISIMILPYSEFYVHGHNDNGGKIGAGYNDSENGIGEVQNDPGATTSRIDWGFLYRGLYASENNK